MKVFLNPHCNYGAGLSKWKKVEKDLYNRIGEFDTEEILSPENLILQVSKALGNGEHEFIAAGGDGTINLLLNSIMKLGNVPGLTIGAVGLGSSNDFHKPFRPEKFIDGIPLKVDFKNAFPCDVIRIEYRDNLGHQNTHFCLINASMGVTAEGNALFNSRIKLIKMLQVISVDAAIIAAALISILNYRNIPCQLIIENSEAKNISVTNLGIIKNPHFTGSLCYDTLIEPDDGNLGINLCIGLSLLERISMLVALYKHRFQGRPKTKSWTVKSLSVKSNQFFALEMDGEVIHTNYAKFNVIPKRVRCCK
jgi:diacylglycerol kinase (ATP)